MTKLKERELKLISAIQNARENPLYLRYLREAHSDLRDVKRRKFWNNVRGFCGVAFFTSLATVGVLTTRAVTKDQYARLIGYGVTVYLVGRGAKSGLEGNAENGEYLNKEIARYKKQINELEYKLLES